MHFAKSINGENYKGYVKDNSTIGTIDKHVSAMPAPKKGATKKKVAAAPEGAEGEKKPAKGKKAPTNPFPVVDPLPEPVNQTVKEALSQATSWSNANNIAKKFAVGTLTTAAYEKRCETFSEMNKLAEEKSSILPQANFLNRHKIPENRDRYDRRII